MTEEEYKNRLLEEYETQNIDDSDLYNALIGKSLGVDNENNVGMVLNDWRMAFESRMQAIQNLHRKMCKNREDGWEIIREIQKALNYTGHPGNIPAILEGNGWRVAEDAPCNKR